MGVTIINTADEFQQNVTGDTSGKLIVVDFFAEWCGPCKIIAPKLEAMSNDMADVLFFKVDVDALGDVAEQHEISAMPTFLYFKNGQKVDSVVGASEENIKGTIEKHRK